MAKEGQALALQEKDIQQFSDYIENTRYAARDKAIFLMGLRSGMRIGTIAQITLKDILDNSGNLKEVITLRRAITKGGKTITAYLSHPELRQAIQDYLKVRRNHAKVDTLFLSQKGGSFSPNTLSKLMLRHFQDAGLDGASSHSNRRTFCTSLLKKGNDIVAVSKVMGHSSIATTQRYVHHDQNEMLGMVSAL